MRGNKYGNKKVSVDDITFDSIKEALRYGELKLLESQGLITEFEIQPVFVLQESFIYFGKMIRAIKYVSDFRYRNVEDDTVYVEDVKGYKTIEYKIKAKMLKNKFRGLVFKEM